MDSASIEMTFRIRTSRKSRFEMIFAQKNQINRQTHKSGGTTGHQTTYNCSYSLYSLLESLSLASSWDPLASRWNSLASSWDPLTSSWNPLASSWNPLASSLNPHAISWNPLASSWNPLASSWNPLASSSIQNINLFVINIVSKVNSAIIFCF